MRNKIDESVLANGFSEDQKSILIGSLLGDGCVFVRESTPHSPPNLCILRAYADKDYLDWEYSYFKDFCLTPPRQRSFFDKRTNKTYESYKFATVKLELLRKYREDWYSDRLKIIPKNIEISSLAMAVWFCDDGCITTPTKPYRLELKLSTHGFLKNDIEFLLDILEKRYDEKFFIHRSDNKFVIKGNDNASRAFLKEIDLFMPKSMSRKSNIWRNASAFFYENIPDRQAAFHKNREDDLSAPEYQIMKFIFQNKLINMKFIREYTNIKGGNLHRYISRLKSMKLILSIDKGSKMKYFLSESGEKLLIKMDKKLAR